MHGHHFHGGRSVIIIAQNINSASKLAIQSNIPLNCSDATVLIAHTTITKKF